MPSDAKSWKTRTVIIKCRYLHLLASSTCCIDAITKIHSTWFEYSHILLGKILRQERDEKLTSGMGVWNQRTQTNVAPPACLVALILIPHGAAFLDGFSMRNVISGDFCVAVAHWLQFLHFLLQFPKIESKKSFWLKKVGESFSKLNFFLKLCFWTKIRFW